MIWLYLVVGGLTVLVVGGLQYYLHNRPKNKLLITLFAVALVLLIMKLYGIPYYQAWTFESDLRKESPFLIYLPKNHHKNLKSI